MAVTRVLFPLAGIVTKDMLEKASQTGVLESNSFSKEFFQKPGVLATSLTENKILPVAYPGSPSGSIVISAGKAVNDNGQLIEVDYQRSFAEDLVSKTNQTLFVKYVEASGSALTTIDKVTLETLNVAQEKVQIPSTIFFWEDSYDPTADPNLTLYPDSVPIGKLVYTGSFEFELDGGHRRLALPKVPWGRAGHWPEGSHSPSGSVSEFNQSVSKWSSLYDFLACEGHSDRSVENPFGASTVDVTNLLATLESVILTGGIPALNLVGDTNKDYLKVNPGTIHVPATVDRAHFLLGSCLTDDGHYINVAESHAMVIPRDGVTYNIILSYKADSEGKDSWETLITTDSPTASQYWQAEAVNVSGPVTVTDKRALLQLRAEAVSPPPVPGQLALTTGAEIDLLRSVDGGYDGGRGVDKALTGAYIKAKWGFDDSNYTGTGGASTFTITPDPGFAVDEVAGQHLIDSAGVVWIVLSNTSNVLTLSETGTPANGAFAIGPDANGYHCVLQFLDDNDNPIVEVPAREQESQQTAPPYVKMEAVWFVPVGSKVRVKVCSQGSWRRDSWSDYCAWVSATAWEVTQIEVGDLNGTAKKGGVVLTWAEVSGAKNYELAITEDDTEPDFAEKAHEVLETTSCRLQYMCESGTKVRAKLRAIDWSGQVSSNTSEVTVVSGSLTADDIVPGEERAIPLASATSMLDRVEDVSSEVTDSRGTYASLSERLSELGLRERIIYPSFKEAGTDATDVPAAFTEWGVAWGNVYYDKIRAMAKHEAPFRYIRLVCELKGTAGENQGVSYVKLSVPELSVEAEVSLQATSLWTARELILDLGNVWSGTLLTVLVSIKDGSLLAGSGTYLRKVILYQREWA